MDIKSKGNQMPKVTDIFADTNEVIEREATAEEIAAQEQIHIESQQAKAAEETAAAELAAKKQAVLERLGITEDEAKALLA